IPAAFVSSAQAGAAKKRACRMALRRHLAKARRLRIRGPRATLRASRRRRRKMRPETPDLIEMLRKMILIREFDELALKLRAAGKIYGTVHPYVGQEAVAVGVCANLTSADRVTSTHRGHGHCIAKGADIKRMMAELFGRVDGYCKGKGGSMHI